MQLKHFLVIQGLNLSLTFLICKPVLPLSEESYVGILQKKVKMSRKGQHNDATNPLHNNPEITSSVIKKPFVKFAPADKGYTYIAL